jgi:hypothetical protein
MPFVGIGCISDDASMRRIETNYSPFAVWGVKRSLLYWWWKCNGWIKLFVHLCCGNSELDHGSCEVKQVSDWASLIPPYSAWASRPKDQVSWWDWWWAVKHRGKKALDRLFEVCALGLNEVRQLPVFYFWISTVARWRKVCCRFLSFPFFFTCLNYYLSPRGPRIMWPLKNAPHNTLYHFV